MESLKKLLLSLTLCSSGSLFGYSGEWSAPVTISDPSDPADLPVVAMDERGQSVIIWNSASIATAFHSHDVPLPGAGGILESASISNDPSSLSVNRGGNGVALWRQFSGGFHTDAAILLDGVWSQPCQLSTGVNFVQAENAVAISGNNRAVALWSETAEGMQRAAVANMVTFGHWEPAQYISAEGRAARAQSVAIDESGNAIAVFTQFDEACLCLPRTAYSFYSAETLSWSPFEYLSEAGFPSDSAKVAMDPNGNAVVLFVQSDGMNSLIYAAMLPFMGPWTTPEPISTFGVDAESPEVAISPEGNVVAIWRESDGSIFQAASAALNGDGSWSAVSFLSEPGVAVLSPKIAVTANGNALAVWTVEETSMRSLQGSTLTFGVGWSLPQTLDTGGMGGMPSSADLSVDPSGNGIAVWFAEWAGPSTIRALLFTPKPDQETIQEDL